MKPPIPRSARKYLALAIAGAFAWVAVSLHLGRMTYSPLVASLYGIFRCVIAVRQASQHVER